MTGQSLLHVLNVAAALVATGVARAAWDAGTAKHVALGALTGVASIAAIGWLVRMATQPEGSASGKGGAVFALISQMFAVGALIWFLRPDGLPFGSGFIAVLGATVLGALVDGVKQSKQFDATEAGNANDDRNA